MSIYLHSHLKHMFALVKNHLKIVNLSITIFKINKVALLQHTFARLHAPYAYFIVHQMSVDAALVVSSVSVSSLLLLIAPPTNWLFPSSVHVVEVEDWLAERLKSNNRKCRYKLHSYLGVGLK